MKPFLTSIVALVSITTAFAAEEVKVRECTISVESQDVQKKLFKTIITPAKEEVVFSSKEQSFSRDITTPASGVEVAFGSATTVLPFGQNFMVSAELRFKSASEVTVALQVSDFGNTLYFLTTKNNPFSTSIDLVNAKTLVETTIPFQGEFTVSAPMDRRVKIARRTTRAFTQMTLTCKTNSKS